MHLIDVHKVGRRQFSGRAHSKCGKQRAARLQALSRIAMTLQAPPHIEWLRLRGQRHPPQFPVTDGACHTLRNMNTVVEMNVIRQPRDSCPTQRFVRRRTVNDRFEHRSVGEQLRMAVEAHTGRRHSRIGGCFHRRMAVTAIDP